MLVVRRALPRLLPRQFGGRAFATESHETLDELEARLLGDLGDERASGRAVWSKNGVVALSGITSAAVGSVVEFENGATGLLYGLDKHGGLAILLSNDKVASGEPATLGPRALSVPVGWDVMGRDLNGRGACIDGEALLSATAPVLMKSHAAPLDRVRVSQQLLTGNTAVDLLAPLGVGQGLLLHGAAGMGKSTAARAVVAAQEATDKLHCVYMAIGEDAAKRVSQLPAGLRDRTTTVTARGSDVPGLRFMAPYVAGAIAQASFERGSEVLLVYDDLTAHSEAFDLMAPALNAVPSAVASIHAPLMHQAAAGHAGGSITVVGVLDTTSSADGTENEPRLLEVCDSSLSFTSPLNKQVWLGRVPPRWQPQAAAQIGGRVKQVLVKLAQLQGTQAMQLSIFGTDGVEADDKYERDCLEKVSALFSLSVPEGLSTAEQGVTAVAAVLNLESSGRLLFEEDSRTLPRLQSEMIQFMHSEHPELMIQLATSLGSASAGEFGDAAVEQASLKIGEFLKGRQKQRKPGEKMLI